MERLTISLLRLKTPIYTLLCMEKLEKLTLTLLLVENEELVFYVKKKFKK